MDTKETISRYFAAIHAGGWESYISDDFVFVNSNLDRKAHGKGAYIEGAGRFFRNTTGVEIRRMLIEGDEVAVVARYNVRSPKGATGVCDTAEFLTVSDGRLTSSVIFFDTKDLELLMSRQGPIVSS